MRTQSTFGRRAGLLMLALLLQPAVTAQAADFISGTYSTSDGCDALTRKDTQSDFLYLTATGIKGGEFHCDFVSVAERKGDPGWVAMALCQEPGLSYPELISILPLEDKRLQLSASQIADVDIAGDYQKCEQSAN